MKILCTGAAGFIGSHAVDLLQERGHEVLALDNFSTGRTENLAGFHGNIVPCDIQDENILEPLFRSFRPQSVLHLAAQSAITISQDNPQHDLRVNGIGTLNLLKLARKYLVSRFVFSSTSAVYRETMPYWRTPIAEKWPLHPESPYGISKLACEHYIRLMFPNHFIMRLGNVYGPRQRPIGGNLVVPRALDHFIHGAEFTVNGHGRQKRDFVYVGDVAECCFEALTSDAVGIFNVSAGKSHSVNEVLGEIEKIYGVRGYRWTHNDQIDPRAYVGLNVRAIRCQLGWKAYTPLSEGLKLTADWWEGSR